MKTILKLMTCMLAFMLLFTTSSCSTKDVNDIVKQQVSEVISETENPEFTDVDSMCIFQEFAVQANKEDSIFTSLSQEVMYQVATVVSKRQTTFTKKDIVLEYLAHKSVYDNLRLQKIRSTTTPYETSSSDTTTLID